MATLIVNPNEIRCGACGAPADPTQPSHDTIPGPNIKPGCGEPFEDADSDFLGLPGVATAMARLVPNLPVRTKP